MLLVDTNIIVAAADESAKEHDQCVQLLAEHDGLTVTAAVAVESAWMIESRLGPRAEAAETCHSPRTRTVREAQG